MRKFQDLLRKVNARKALIYLIILEYFQNYRNGDLMKVYDYVLDHPDNKQFNPKPKTKDGRGLGRDYIKPMEEAGILNKHMVGKKQVWQLNKDYFLDLEDSTFNLKNEELNYLKSYNSILSKYWFLGYPSSIEKMIEELEKVLSDLDTSESFSAISLDTRTEFKGEQEFPTIREAIEERNPISFTYTKFPLGSNRKSETKNIKRFLPYLLKEHNGRWYVVGKINSGKKYDYISYSLDRISNVDFKNETFEREAFNEEDLWKHSMGIYTAWEDGKGNWKKEPLTISFKVKDGERYHNISYLESNPFHPSQKNGKYDKDGYVKFSLEMYPDADLIRVIRSLGAHNVKDIKPRFLSDWVFYS